MIKAIAVENIGFEVRNLRISELVQILPEGYTHAPRPTDVSSSPTVAHRCDERRGCIWFTKERKKRRKERKRRRREKKGGKIHLSVTPLLRFIHSFESLGTERERKKGPLRRIDKKRIPTPAQQGGPFPFYLEERNPCAVKPLDRPCR